MKKKKTGGKVASQKKWPHPLVDKEKSIKPNWLIEVRNWLGAMSPSGKTYEYFQVDFLSDPGWDGDPLRAVRKVVIKFFTHTYQYTIEISERQFDVVTALKRKAHAGSECRSGTDIVNPCPRTPEMWSYVLNQIMAWEMCKVFKDARQEEAFEQWEKMDSHYIQGKSLMYAEWEQKGGQIRNHKVFRHETE